VPVGTGLATLQVKSRRLLVEAAPPSPSQRMRSWMERRLELPSCAEPGAVRPGRALLRALLFGDPACLEDETSRSLRRVGLGHLLAVSGLHVGLLVLVVSVAAAPLPRPLAHGALAVALLVYLVAVGGRASLLRALLMLSALACARASSRPIGSLNALAVVAAGLAWLEPRAVSEPGFQLSFAATAGILLLAVPWSRASSASYGGGGSLGSRGRRVVLGGLAVTLSAQLFTLPFVAHAFSFVSPSAGWLNLVAVPWTAVALGVALPCALFALLPLGGLSPLDGVLDLLAAPHALTALLPPRGWVVWPLSWSVSPGAVTVAMAALAFAGRRRLALLLLGLGVAIALVTVEAPRGAEVILLDVGQGDALLLRDDDGTVLVDGGGAPARDFGGRVLMPALARLGVRRIDLAIVSHGDVDHCGGVADLATRIPIDEVWLPPGLDRSSCGRRLHELVGERLRVVSRGDARSVGDARYRVLWPASGSRWRGNDASLVIRAAVGGVRVLLTGDIEATAEQRLVALGPLRADLLKVPHHGSRTSTSPQLLRAVAPRAALLSAGRGNRYGHPHAEPLERLRGEGIVVWRSDRHGRVVLELPGARGWRVRASATPGPGPGR
jgi:competence protein ComEC